MRIKKVPVKPKKPGTFEKNHTKSVGNKGYRLAARKGNQFFRQAILHFFDRRGFDDEGNSRAMDRIARELYMLATAGGKQSLEAIKTIMDRIDGKALQAIEHSGNLQNPIPVITRRMTAKEALSVLQDNLNWTPDEEDDE